MANTTFLDLLKPLGTDKVKVGDLNANWDKIDMAWGGRLTGRAVTAALPVSGWSDNAQTVSVDRVTATAAVVVSPAPESWAAYGKAGVRCTAQGDGTLTFTCDTAPADDLTVNVLIFKGVAG